MVVVVVVLVVVVVVVLLLLVVLLQLLILLLMPPPPPPAGADLQGDGGHTVEGLRQASGGRASQRPQCAPSIQSAAAACVSC